MSQTISSAIKFIIFLLIFISENRFSMKVYYTINLIILYFITLILILIIYPNLYKKLLIFISSNKLIVKLYYMINLMIFIL